MKALARRIKRGAQAVGDFQARLILSLFYYVLVLPTGLTLKLGGDLLSAPANRKRTSYWSPRTTEAPELKTARRQG